MFTGIIEEIGTLQQIKRSGQSLQLIIAAKMVTCDIKIGDSIAVNGVCLTVTSFNPHNFSADVMPVTFKDTNLSELKSGDCINLERAMAANGRFGGHIVSGHVDGVGKIISIATNQNARVLRIALAKELAAQCIAKGSIALDGTSLTLVAVGQDWLEVALIPHTQQESYLGSKTVGCSINIECDILAKQLIKATKPSKGLSKISRNFLEEHGFL